MCQLVGSNKCSSSFARDFNLPYFSWGESPRSVQALRHKPGDSDFDSRRVPWKFSSDLFLLSAFSSPRVHSASNRNFLQTEVLPELRADNSAVLVGPNVQVRKEAQHSAPPPTSPESSWLVTRKVCFYLSSTYVLIAKASTINKFLHILSRIKEIIPRLNPHICTKC